MTCLLLNMEPDLSDPRVAIARDRVIAAQILSALPHRIGWMLSDEDDLARPADWAPEILGRVTLSIPALVRVHNTFAPNTVNRFESRPVAARRTARLLLGKFGIINEERGTMSEVHEHGHEHGHEHTEHTEHTAPPIADEPESFTLAPGVRVTLLPDASKGIPEEHGVVLEVADDFVSVEVDPLYRVNEQDDGHRDVEARECGPDPVGEMRMKVETVKTKKAISAELEAAKTAKAADREAKKAERETAKAQKAADREAKKTAKATKAKAPKAPKAPREPSNGVRSKHAMSMVEQMAFYNDLADQAIARGLPFRRLGGPTGKSTFANYGLGEAAVDKIQKALAAAVDDAV